MPTATEARLEAELKMYKQVGGQPHPSKSEGFSDRVIGAKTKATALIFRDICFRLWRKECLKRYVARSHAAARRDLGSVKDSFQWWAQQQHLRLSTCGRG